MAALATLAAVGLWAVKQEPHAQNRTVGVMDAFWHLVNFFAPALGLGVMASGLAKLLWWRLLRLCGWGRLALWASVSAAAANLACLMWQGRDGTMAAYACMLLACSLGLAWAGFIAPPATRRSGRSAGKRRPVPQRLDA